MEGAVQQPTTQQPAPQASVAQFYETKLFRVLVAQQALVEGHVIIEPKSGDPHLYSFDLDEMEEFMYVLKKVSFWAMRLTGATGFTVLTHDGTLEVDMQQPLQVHVLPRRPGEAEFTGSIQEMQEKVTQMEEGTVLQVVDELQRLMQLPQNNV